MKHYMAQLKSEGEIVFSVEYINNYTQLHIIIKNDDSPVDLIVDFDADCARQKCQKHLLEHQDLEMIVDTFYYINNPD